jgi:hypothetical protein
MEECWPEAEVLDVVTKLSGPAAPVKQRKNVEITLLSRSERRRSATARQYDKSREKLFCPLACIAVCGLLF